MGIYVPQRHKICKKEAVLGCPWSPAARGRGRCGRLGARRSRTGGLAPRVSGRASGPDQPVEGDLGVDCLQVVKGADHGESEAAGVADEAVEGDVGQGAVAVEAGHRPDAENHLGLLRMVL